MATGMLLGAGGCGQSPEPQAIQPIADETTQVQISSSAEEQPPASNSSHSTTVEASPQNDYFRDAVNRAGSAVSIGQTAHSESDWQLAVNRWQQAIELMGQVPNSSPNYATAQTKIKEYQNNLKVAQQRASGETVQTTTAPASPPPGLVAQIPILQRRGGTPLVPVTLKGQKGSQKVTMLFDTGATGTLITPAMADALGVVIVDQAIVTIADGSQVTMPIGYLDYIEVGGFKREGVLVAIGGDVGLLGQDVYGEFGISMGSQVINLYR
ncbi:hypothetical protein C7271_25310 [filamentous cyanobacterium CCP5]|nr:hypothetical protein C7271_25310 [filamentous cyanobacterium CCP5]